MRRSVNDIKGVLEILSGLFPMGMQLAPNFFMKAK
jgi:hypothetical protein